MYTYLIGWKEHDKWYYGVRLRYVGSPQDDLWVKYKTSSKYVKRFSEEYGDPDVIRVHKEFTSRKDASDYEYKFLKRVNAKKNPRWLNQTIMGAPMGGSESQMAAARRPKSDEHKKKIGDAIRGNKREDWSNFLSEMNKNRTGAKHPNFGKKRSPETLAKISAALKGKPRAKRGPMSEETKRKISEAKRRKA